MKSLSYALITVTYHDNSKRRIVCALTDLESDPTQDEILEAAEEQGFIEDSDLNFELKAVALTEEEFVEENEE